MENKYVIISRYESFTSTGKTFSNWFVYDSNPRTEKEAKERIKEIKKDFGYIDQKTKLKHEYELKPYKDYENDRKVMMNDVKKAKKKQEAYYKSDAYKELQKKKRQAKKELKERQQKYFEEHFNV